MSYEEHIRRLTIDSAKAYLEEEEKIRREKEELENTIEDLEYQIESFMNDNYEIEKEYIEKIELLKMQLEMTDKALDKALKMIDGLLGERNEKIIKELDRYS